MQYFPDILAFCCLFLDGFYFGYYCKYAYIFEHFQPHWFALVGVLVSLTLASIWTLKKHRDRGHSYDHFYVIFYGLICFVISSCLMINGNIETSFYFGFLGHATIFLPCFSFINLRSPSKGKRPACLALGNALYFSGLTTGFAIFDEFDANVGTWTLFGLTLLAIVAIAANEILQYTSVHNYRRSRDLVFNLLNDEKMVFVPIKSIYAQFVGRPDFYMSKSQQSLVVSLFAVLVLERSLIYSFSYLNLSWSSTLAYTGETALFAPFLCYAFGALLGSALLIKYKPKLVYLMFGLIKITTIAAILGIYSEFVPEDCFIFLGFYYTSMGFYSSIALQGILECSPFLFTELNLALAYAFDLVALDAFKYEAEANDVWPILLGIGIANIVLTSVCIVIVQFYLPKSTSLIEIRNRLLGIHRNKPAVPQSKIWNANGFLQHDPKPCDLTTVSLGDGRVFQQNPYEIERSTNFERVDNGISS